MNQLHFFLFSPFSFRHLTRLLLQTSSAFNYTSVPPPSVSNPLIRAALGPQTLPQRRMFHSLFDAVGTELDYVGIDRFQINQLVWKLLLPGFHRCKSYCAPLLNKATIFLSFSIYLDHKIAVGKSWGKKSLGRSRCRCLNYTKGLSDFIHRPDSKYLENKKTRRFGNWNCFRSQAREDTYSFGSLTKS
jgi:hypothetical protein